MADDTGTNRKVREIVTYKAISEGQVEVKFENGVVLGDLICGDDGFFNFWPLPRAGYWPSFILRHIADELDRLNKPWQDTINKDLG